MTTPAHHHGPSASSRERAKARARRVGATGPVERAVPPTLRVVVPVIAAHARGRIQGVRLEVAEGSASFQDHGLIPAGGTLADMEPETEHGYLHAKDAYLKRLRRIEGQARGLQRMVEEEQYCIDILTQVSAMTKALQSVALGLLDEHIAHCVADAVKEGGSEAEVKMKEASDAIARLVRS